MKYVIPAAVTVKISIPASHLQNNVSNFVVDVELVTDASNTEEALINATNHLEKDFLKRIKIELKNYSISRKPIPLKKKKDTPNEAE
ncbi:MAG: hypothetical protein P9M13_01985 [Candidatus Ancaeobacter aquaticus]|nr:hypothetical protein [Candidatus Ancaeobacter aquaticus]